MRESVSEKAEKLIRLVQKELPKADKHSIRKACGRLSNHYCYKKSKRYKPSETEIKIYEITLRNNISIAQAYKWLLLMDAPADIQELLQQRKISIKNAFREIKRRSREELKMTASKRRFKAMIRSCFELNIHPLIGTP